MYLGAAHNPVTFDRFSLRKNGDTTFSINADMNVLFELEGVAKNESFTISAVAEFIGEA